MNVPAKPFVKAAGGKTKLASKILAHVPDFGAYHEPFLGGGAIFLAVAKARRVVRSSLSYARPWAFLGDANEELMNAYGVVKQSAQKLGERLAQFKHSKDDYYVVRAKEESDPLERAARFIYLNKTCFNGLYRVNSAGKFNVPFGKFKNPKFAEPLLLLAWQEILQGADLHSKDFGDSIAAAAPGDFIYCDPPYLPRSKSAEFTSYTAAGFSLKDHERLADTLDSASKRGVKFLCSQGDSDAIRSLYKSFSIESVSVRHSVAARGAARLKVAEVLIANYSFSAATK
jgi:DNA adenine methylase